MSKNGLGNLFIFLLVAINLLLWLIFPPQDDGRENFDKQFTGEMVSTSALILLSSAIFLANRPRWVEPYFGGLDKMFRTHRIVATTVALLLLAHYLIMAIWTGNAHWDPSLAKIAFLGVQISILLALAPRLPLLRTLAKIPYHRWRVIHRFTGLFFLVGILHALRIDNVMKLSVPVISYVLTIAGIGALLYLYKELVAPFLQKGRRYVVRSVRPLPGPTAEVTLAPVDGKMEHRAGQFLVVRFPEVPGLREPHPFTISSAPGEDALRLTIKASGDFTSRLLRALPEQAEARVEGSYGRFDYHDGLPEQIWIAGGIGLTPFLSWIRDFDFRPGRQIHFYYSVRSQQDALFLDELDRAQSSQPGFWLYLHCSDTDGRLTMEKIATSSGPVAQKEVYLCGPAPMITSLKVSLMEAGVPEERIHYEEFSFR